MLKKSHIRECSFCGKIFSVLHKSNPKKCCSFICAHRQAKYTVCGPLPIYICKKCGKKFNPKKDKFGRVRSYKPSNNNKYLYCSRKCSDLDVKSYLHKREKKKIPFSRIHFYHCIICKKTFSSRYSRKNPLCSNKCATIFYNKKAKESYKPKTSNVRCILCGQPFDTNGHNWRFCSTKCKKENARIVKYNGKLKRKVHKDKGIVEQINPLEIFMRDGWKCRICGGKINKEVKAPHPMSASIDHIIPISKGGQHIKANIQCAHFICNSEKSDKVSKYGDQLRLL